MMLDSLHDEKTSEFATIAPCVTYDVDFDEQLDPRVMTSICSCDVVRDAIRCAFPLAALMLEDSSVVESASSTSSSTKCCVNKDDTLELRCSLDMLRNEKRFDGMRASDGVDAVSLDCTSCETLIESSSEADFRLLLGIVSDRDASALCVDVSAMTKGQNDKGSARGK